MVFHQGQFVSLPSFLSCRWCNLCSGTFTAYTGTNQGYPVTLHHIWCLKLLASLLLYQFNNKKHGANKSIGRFFISGSQTTWSECTKKMVDAEFDRREGEMKNCFYTWQNMAFDVEYGQKINYKINIGKNWGKIKKNYYLNEHSQIFGSFIRSSIYRASVDLLYISSRKNGNMWESAISLFLPSFWSFKPNFFRGFCPPPSTPLIQASWPIWPIEDRKCDLQHIFNKQAYIMF